MDNYPPNMSKADYDHVEGNDSGYADWFQDHEDELVDMWLSAGNSEKAIGGPRWVNWLEARWEDYCGGDGPLHKD